MRASANPAARFTNMSIDFHTGSDDKNPTSRLEIFISPGNNIVPNVGYADIEGQGFPNDSDRTIMVPPVGPGFTLADLRNEQIGVKITHQDGTNDSDSWIFNFSATLTFDDGTKASLDSETTGLDLDHVPIRWWPLAPAIVS
jgi:hypothetical protein